MLNKQQTLPGRSSTGASYCFSFGGWGEHFCERITGAKNINELMFTQISWGKELPMNCLFFFLFLFLKLPSLLIAWDLRNIRKLRAAYSVSENFIQLVSNRVPWWIGITKAIKFHPTWGVGEKSTQPPEVFHPRILLDGKKVLLQHP